MKIIYFHGFNSTGNGSTANMLKSIYKQNVISPTYTFVNAKKAFLELNDIVKNYQLDDEVILVGTSLGGFWANYFSEKYKLPCVLINPSIFPNETLKKYIGENNNFISGQKYTFTQRDIDTYTHYITHSIDADKYLLLSKNDEIIDYKIAEQHFTGRVIYINSTEGHQIKNKNLIIELINRALYNCHL